MHRLSPIDRTAVGQPDYDVVTPTQRFAQSTAAGWRGLKMSPLARPLDTLRQNTAPPNRLRSIRHSQGPGRHQRMTRPPP